MSKKRNDLKNVQPIRCLKQIEDMKWSLKRWCSQRDYIIFLLGINSGLRIGDLLNIKTSTIQNKRVVYLREGKTGKSRTIHLDNIYEELDAYICTIQGSKWLFPSRKGNAPITRIQAYRQLNKAAEMVDISTGIGTHTLRKTFGYWHYKQFKDIAELQNILNHTHPQITLRYIGITDEQIESNLKAFRL